MNARLSYALYLVHLPLVPLAIALSAEQHFLVFWASYLILSYALALVIHFSVERPFLMLKDSLGQPRGSLLPLPKPYVVPGGRFREVYYWDSYFTLLGLASSGRWQQVRDMVDNFAWQLDQYGHIPNGNRSYYLSRSQPPFSALTMACALDSVPPDEKMTTPSTSWACTRSRTFMSRSGG